jgi:predicted  nucleic acid-binding Zn-ribbon protein
MYTCERCGTRFGRPAAVLESCPRCLAREGVRVSLAFRVLEDHDRARTEARLPGGLEAAVRQAQAGEVAGEGGTALA